MQLAGNVHHVWGSGEDHSLPQCLLPYFREFEIRTELCSQGTSCSKTAQPFGAAEGMGNCSFLWREFQLLQTQTQLRKLLWPLIYLSGFERYKLTHCRALQRNSKIMLLLWRGFNLCSCVAPIIQVPDPVSQELISTHPLLPHQDSLG